MTKISTTMRFLMLGLALQAGCLSFEASDPTLDDSANADGIAFDYIVDVPSYNVPAGERGVVKSKQEFLAKFDMEAPAEINFRKSWVAYYHAPAREDGKPRALVTAVKVSDEGVYTVSTKNSLYCESEPEAHAELAVVVFDKPDDASAEVKFRNRVEQNECPVVDVLSCPQLECGFRPARRVCDLGPSGDYVDFASCQPVTTPLGTSCAWVFNICK